jgi:NAD(P)-dependent dehydrogenase (short-subunit alcohol dehydrogenase family)
MGRAGRPADIVGTVVYLASAASGFATGAVIKLDGGSAL